MSFGHHTIVGHFDPVALRPFNVVPTRNLDVGTVKTLLSQYPPEIAERVEICDGYVRCCWATGGLRHDIGKSVHEFAYRLAEQERCIAAELPLCLILYPESAMQAQQQAIKEWNANRKAQKNEPPK